MRSARLNPNAASRRRGVTLLEMLVTVALLLLMMVTIAAVFQAATGSVTTSRTLTQLDQDLRRLDTIIRQDLHGITCKMTPPNNPKDGKGYFEYAENALSDAQDEDSDDIIRFTAQAPDNRPFTGRRWVSKTNAITTRVTVEPYPVTSQYAEIIYFQRGTNLYRRVLLIDPTAAVSFGNTPTDTGAMRVGFATNLFEPFALFQNGTNASTGTYMHLANGTQVSAQITLPATSIVTPADGFTGARPFVSWQALNDLSARPSVATSASYAPIPNSLGDLTDRQNRFANPRFADDYVLNSAPTTFAPDGVPDDVNSDGVPDYYPTMYFNSKAALLLNDTFTAANTFTVGMTTVSRPLDLDRTAFPFVFPNSYYPNFNSTLTPNWRDHSQDQTNDPAGINFNHNPLAVGDSLARPDVPPDVVGPSDLRETAAPTWLDPINRLNDPSAAGFYTAGDPIISTLNETANTQTKGLSALNTFNGTPFRLPPLPSDFSDGTPAANQNDVYDLGEAPVFEDDLIATNVRSFNVKAFDPSPRIFVNGVLQAGVPGYFDLGYAVRDSVTGTITTSATTGTFGPQMDSLGHEGRMPPFTGDGRVDPQFPAWPLGDNNAAVQRLIRTWDSWSTTYTLAPGQPLDPTLGPYGGFRPVVPSYPAPYPVPLRGLEIQIRLTDPASKHVKTLTIRQDFSEKL